jgi:hypothetical protein
MGGAAADALASASVSSGTFFRPTHKIRWSAGKGGVQEPFSRPPAHVATTSRG